MNRIAITGSFKTGKSAFSAVLSNLTGFQYIRPVTDYELRETFKQFNKEPDQFYTYYINCLFRLSNRLRNEALAENCFISDGCIFNEVASLWAYHEISCLPRAKNKEQIKQSRMVAAIENAVSDLFKNRYDKIIKIDTDMQIAEMSKLDLQFKQYYDIFLQSMLYKSGQPYHVYHVRDFETDLRLIIQNEKFEQRRSVEEAIYKVKNYATLHEIFSEREKV